MRILALVSVTSLVFLVSRAFGAPEILYYDTNGATGGTSTTSTQNFTDAVWTLDPTGSLPTTGYVSGSDIVFSADDGVNVGTGAQNVTVTDTEAADGFTFNNGIVTLYGSGSPNLSIGAGGITVNSDDGATTFDSSLGTVALSASQAWNNDSTQALNVNSGINGNGATLTFNGTGAGAVNLSGVVSNVNLVQESASSTLYLTNNNSVNGTTIGNDATIVAAGDPSVGGTVTFNNGGGTLTFTNPTNFGNTLIETAPIVGTEHGATLNFTGDSALQGGTNNFTANLLTLGSGDALDETSGTQSITTLDLLGSGVVNTDNRLIVGIGGQGLGLINGSTINVENSYTLDFGSSGTVGNLINVQSGGAIENRSNGTVTLTDVNLPTSGQITLGSDDAGGGALDFTNALALTGDLTIHVQTANPTSVTLGNISETTSGTNLNITGSTQVNSPNSSSPLYLAGTDTYTGATTLEAYASPQNATRDYAPYVEITGNSSGVGTNFNIEEGTLAVGATGTLPTGAAINLGFAANGAVDYFQVGDSGSAASVTVGSITSLSANGALDKIVGGNSGVSNLTVDVAANVNDIYYGNIGSGNGNQDNFYNPNQDNISLTVDGPGVLTVLRGDSDFTGGVFIDGVGTLDVGDDGAIGPDSNNVTLTNGGTLFLGTSVPVYGNATPTSGGGFSHDIILGTGGGTLNGQGDYEIYSTISGGTGLTLVGGDFLSNSGSADNVGTMNVNGGRLLAFSNGIFGNNAVFNDNATLDFNFNGTVTNTINVANGAALENRSTSVSLTDVVIPTGTASIVVGADDVGGGSISLNGPTINLANGTTLTIVANAAEHYTEFTSTDVPPPVSASDPNFNAVFDTGGLGQTAVHVEEQITGSGNLIITPEEAPVINNTTGDVVGYRLGVGSPIYLDGANNYSGTTTVDGAIVYVGASGFGTSAVTLNGNLFQTPYFDNVTQIELSGGTFSNPVTVGVGTNIMNVLAGSPDETITGPITMTAANAVLVMANSSSSTLNVGSIHFDAVSGSSHNVNFEDYGSGPIVLTGTYSSDPESTSQSSMSLNFGDGGEGTGVYDLAATADFTGMQTNDPGGYGALELDSGTLNIETNNFAGQVIDVQYYTGTNHTINFVGARTLDYFSYVNIGNGAWTLNQSTADQSVYSGGFGLYDSTFDVSAVDGGRLNITGDIAGYSFDTFLTKTGSGTVVLDNPNGNNFNDQQYPNNNGVLADVQQGTLLINNSQGHAMGTDSGTVNVENGATFGGSGSLASGQTVVSENAGSIIAPGDAGQANLGIAPKIGTLTIAGTLTTASNADPTTDGVTLDFKLNGYADGSTSPVNTPGVNNDLIVADNLTLNGTITINLTVVGNAPLLTGPGNYYILMQGGVGNRGGNPTFVINTPAGYALDTSFGSLDAAGDAYLGYDYDLVDQDFTIQLIAVPEPSTYGLLGLGLLALVAFRRLRKIQV